MRRHFYWVYILASGPSGYLYVGVTNDLVRRVEEHRAGRFESHTRTEGITRLVWFETHQYVDRAILREKRIKRWLRPWKFALVEERNPKWLDLYGGLVVDRLPTALPDQAPAGTPPWYLSSRTSPRKRGRAGTTAPLAALAELQTPAHEASQACPG